MIGIGSRVRYTNGVRTDWLDLDATVTTVWESGKVDVEFDKPWGGSHTAGRHIPLSSLKELPLPIDPKRAIETIEDEPRQCRTIGILERREGVITVLLAVPYRGKEDTGEVEINLDGKPVSGTYVGGALSFRNTPKVESGFYPVDKMGMPTGRGLTVLSIAMSDYPGVQQFMEIVRVDGVPTEAKYHVR